MKKYSSGSFVDAAVRVYGSEADTITSFPASIIANGGNISPWTVYGNTVEGASVGDRTTNLLDFNALQNAESGIIGTSSCPHVLELTLEANTDYTCISDGAGSTSGGAGENRSIYFNGTDTTNVVFAKHPVTLTTGETGVLKIGFFSERDNAQQYINGTAKVWIIKGNTTSSYEPFGYNVPIICNSIAYNCYISDVLRKSSGADPVYDIMSSTGVITRNVDTDGTPLVTPTTESFTAPTLATVAGSQSVSFDTTVKPSKAELTYTGWHTHDDKKRSGGAWT